MRLVHLSDVHLGYRQYQRLTPRGVNQREWDVANTFRQAIERIVELKPELILIAGDLFHTARPSNAAILHAFQQFVRLTRALPDAEIVIAAGDHDTPRTSESGSIMGLFEQIGVHVATSEPRRFRLSPELSVFAVPDGPTPQLAPDERARYNVLVMHAHVREVVPQYYAELDRATTTLSRADLDLKRWSYVALGHYHVHARIAQNAYYSGSLDYTSLNVWFDKSEEDEASLKGKGFIEYDLDSGRHTYHPLEPSRAFLDLKPIVARGMSPAEVDAAIRKSLEKVKGGIDDKVVRLVVRDISRPVARELDHRAIREYKRRALNFHLDLRKPETSSREASGAPLRRPSVVEFVRERLQTREIPPDLERERLVELGLHYLNEADAFATPSASAADPG